MTVGAQRSCIYPFFFVCVFFLDSTFYVMEGSCFEQSEPVLQRKPLHGSVGANHQPARAMKRHKTCEEDMIICTRVVWTLMDTLPSRDQIPKCSKMLMRQENFGRKEKKTKQKKKHNCCLPGDVFKWGGKKEKLLQGMDFHFGQKRLRVASGSREKMRRRGWRIKPKACVCFSMWRRTLYRRTVSCMRGSRSARRREGAEETENGAAARSEARPREPSTCSNTGPLMQFHTLEYYIVHVDVAVVRNGKRERLHIQWRHSVYYCFLLPQVK